MKVLIQCLLQFHPLNQQIKRNFDAKRYFSEMNHLIMPSQTVEINNSNNKNNNNKQCFIPCNFHREAHSQLISAILHKRSKLSHRELQVHQTKNGNMLEITRISQVPPIQLILVEPSNCNCNNQIRLLILIIIIIIIIFFPCIQSPKAAATLL